MTTHFKFLLFVQTILADQKYDSRGQTKCLILEDAMEVTEFDLSILKSLIIAAREFVDWRTNYGETNAIFDNVPKWLSKETVSKILLG